MADPLAITSLALQIGAILKHLYEYGKAVKDAQQDIRMLCTELSALKGILADFQESFTACECRKLVLNDLQNTGLAVKEVLNRITPKSTTSQRIKCSLAWPLQGSDIKKLLMKVARTKTLLLLDLMGEFSAVMQNMGSLKDDVALIALSMREDVTNRERQKQRDNFYKLLTFIGPASPFLVHKKACSVWKGSASGSWFVDGPLRIWSQDQQLDQRILALVGSSGTGKTTLISRAIEQLKDNSDDAPVAYLYCAYNDDSTRDVRNVLGSWVAQLGPIVPNACSRFESLAAVEDDIPSNLLVDALVEIADTVGKVLLVLDSINETKKPVRLALTITDLVQRSRNIRILFSATHLDMDLIPELHGNCHEILMTTAVMDADIRAFVQRQRLASDVLSRVPEHEIVDVVLSRANGMFRWAACQMEGLAEQPTPNKAREALTCLPKTLDESYMVLLERVSDPYKHFVREALVWLSLSLRPLKIEELAEAVVFEVEDGAISHESRLPRPERLIEMCHGLVVWDAPTNTVSLAHGSIRSFLRSLDKRKPVAEFGFETYEATKSIAIKCLNYLLMDTFITSDRSERTLKTLNQTYPLYGYASQWPVHVYDSARRPNGLPVEVQVLIDRFFWTHRTNPHDGQFAFWVANHEDPQVVEDSHPLYLAASFGLTQTVTSLLDSGHIDTSDRTASWYIDKKCGRGRSTALERAVWRGYSDIVAILLEAGADPNATDANEISCLECAYRRGHLTIADQLLAAGALDDKANSEDRLGAIQRGIIGKSISAVHCVIAEVLCVPPESITDDVSLGDCGVDSLVAFQLTRELHRKTGMELPSPLWCLEATPAQIEKALRMPCRGIETHGL